MSITRHTIGHAIASQFLPSKRATVEAAAAQAECLATLLRSRLNARLEPGEGADIIDNALRGLSHSVEAAECQQRVHASLATFRERYRIPPMAYGVEDTRNEASLRVVDTVAA